MPPPSQRQVLLDVIDRLAAEVGYTGTPLPETRSRLAAQSGRGMVDVLEPDDESFVEHLSLGLAKIPAALGAGEPAGGFEPLVSAALEGAELVMRDALVNGQIDQLTLLLPSFVFLVAHPVAGQDDALALSCRVEEMTREGLGG